MNVALMQVPGGFGLHKTATALQQQQQQQWDAKLAGVAVIVEFFKGEAQDTTRSGSYVRALKECTMAWDMLL